MAKLKGERKTWKSVSRREVNCIMDTAVINIPHSMTKVLRTTTDEYIFPELHLREKQATNYLGPTLNTDQIQVPHRCIIKETTESEYK